MPVSSTLPGMVEDDDIRRLDPDQDPAALKALTHPLRIRLLGLLRFDGPATASELAARTGESSASTSYHLRVLARHDFVAEAEHRDARERRWKAVHTHTSWSNTAMSSTPDSRAFLDVLRRAQLDHLERSIAQHQDDLATGRISDEWREPAGVTDSAVRLTPRSLDELFETFEAKAAELAARDAEDAAAETVFLFMTGLPVASPAPKPDAS